MSASFQQYRALGLMSGTSLDGLDIALIRFSTKPVSFVLEKMATLPYSSDWREKLRYSEQSSFQDLLALNSEYGFLLGSMVRDFLAEHKIPREELDFIASHGHTYYHQPQRGFSYQLGSGPELAISSGITAIVDFRQQDIALGGQGAPLVPIGDRDLFDQYDACLNLGGFANISLRGTTAPTLAYDIVPVNFLLNPFAERLQLPYDAEGKIAASHAPLPELLEELQNLPYYARSAPKSLGAEWVKEHTEPILRKYDPSPERAIATLTEHAARQIASNLVQHKCKNVLITGGGALNEYLMRRVRYWSGLELPLPEMELIHYKEALIFGYLGLLRLQGEVNVLSSATGASHNHSSGVIFHPPR